MKKDNDYITITIDIKGFYKKVKKLQDKKIPFVLFVVLLLMNSTGIGLVEYYVMKTQFEKKLSENSVASEDSGAFVKRLTAKVVPQSGYTTSVSWGDLGKKLVEVGAIDEAKYAEIFTSSANGGDEMGIIKGNAKNVAINEKNARFVVNTLWALGLVNKSKVLDGGPLRTGDTPTANFASTAGWTLGTKSAMELYSSKQLIALTEEEQELVYKIAENVYRPCCGNHSAFPDCNHGMAALGYIQMAVAQGVSEKQIYKDLLAMNSYWFPSTYVEMAAYFEKEENTTWDNIDAKKALSYDYSSALGAQNISTKVSDIPGFESSGGSCGA